MLQLKCYLKFLFQSDSADVVIQNVGVERICIVHDGSEDPLSREEQLPPVEPSSNEGWYNTIPLCVSTVHCSDLHIMHHSTHVFVVRTSQSKLS